LRNVPGRKTDVADAVWIGQLVEHGLVRPSFVPPKPIRDLRNLTRYRKAQIEERTREAQRLDKVLQDAGIKLSSVASDILGVSGRAMLHALVAGSQDPQTLAELARGALRKKLPALREALTGRFGAHHALLVGAMLAKLEAMKEKHRVVGEVRGRGLMLGIELVSDRKTKEPIGKDFTRALYHECLRRGLVAMTYSPSVRINPPLVITEDAALAGLAILDESLEATASAHGLG